VLIWREERQHRELPDHRALEFARIQVREVFAEGDLAVGQGLDRGPHGGQALQSVDGGRLATLLLVGRRVGDLRRGHFEGAEETEQVD